MPYSKTPTRCFWQRSRQHRRGRQGAREVRLTTLGEQVLAEILPVITELQDDILPGLDEDERSTFFRLAAKAVGSAPSPA